MADFIISPPKNPDGTLSRTNGPFKSGKPTIIVIHDLEAPPRDGIAVDLANGYLQNERVSIHGIVDTRDSVRMMPLNLTAWHCGTGNAYSVGIEQTGYASWDFATWTDPHNFQGVRNAARMGAKFAKELGWGPETLRWLTDQEARDGVKGFATHNTMRRVFGGTTHTDPGTGFPDQVFMKMVQEFYGVPVTPEPDPNPDSPGPGGAEDEDDMAKVFQDPATGWKYVASMGYFKANNDEDIAALVNDGMVQSSSAQSPTAAGNTSLMLLRRRVGFPDDAKAISNGQGIYVVDADGSTRFA